MSFHISPNFSVIFWYFLFPILLWKGSDCVLCLCLGSAHHTDIVMNKRSDLIKVCQFN